MAQHQTSEKSQELIDAGRELLARSDPPSVEAFKLAEEIFTRTLEIDPKPFHFVRHG